MPESSFELRTGWGCLAGTLSLPAGPGPWPAALLIAGSGPTDRDGNTPLLPEPIDNLRRLAEALAAVDPDALTPREALEQLYRLKRLAEERGR